MRPLAAVAFSCTMVWVWGGCAQSPPASTGVNTTVADSAQTVQPIGVGRAVPEVTLTTVDGKSIALRRLVTEQPTILIFYRGGWCPYCTRHLGMLGKLEPDLKALGYRIVAVSPDRPAKLAESIAGQELGYMLLSDSDMTAARAFGLAFHVDESLVERYRTEYGIDLEADSGRTHHQLPVPAAYIVDETGTIRYLYFNPDYKVRITEEELLRQARLALEE